IVVLYVGLRRQKEKETLMSSKEDIRDNVIHYDDEGGGEEDTHAFDMGTLRNPKVVKDNLYRRRDIKPLEAGRGQRGPVPVSQDSADIRDFIHQRLEDHDVDNSAPPYDSLVTYAYEGDGSVAESLSSIGSPPGAGEQQEEDYDYLNDWGPRFKTLAGIFGEKSPESQSDTATTENSH
ncbi:hypothetical protein CRUP_007121, partial [Coryphaenoides rupestris]